jgi:hypothetical protein
MTRCVRCGLEQAEHWTDTGRCSAHLPDNDSGVIDCRNRELTNLHSLLRSVTGQLEQASQRCADCQPITAKMVIDSVLEALS